MTSLRYNPTDLERRVYTYLQGLLGSTELIYANQDGARPTGDSYFTFYVSGGGGRGRPEVSVNVSDDVEPGNAMMRVEQMSEAPLIVTGYGPDAYGTLLELDNLIRSPYYTEQASTDGLSIEMDGDITRIPTVVGPQTENRATKTYLLRYELCTDIEVPALGEVEATAEIDDLTNIITVNFDIID